MPRIIQTNPDGSPIPDYLTQSAVGRPLRIGTIQMSPSGLLYGYSGEVNFDGTAAASYPFMDFQLYNSVLFKLYFSADYSTLSTNKIGYSIAIDGTTVFYYTTRNIADAPESWPTVIENEFIVPANKAVQILLLNPQASTALCKGNITLRGSII